MESMQVRNDCIYLKGGVTEMKMRTLGFQPGLPASRLTFSLAKPSQSLTKQNS